MRMFDHQYASMWTGSESVCSTAITANTAGSTDMYWSIAGWQPYIVWLANTQISINGQWMTLGCKLHRVHRKLAMSCMCAQMRVAHPTVYSHRWWCTYWRYNAKYNPEFHPKSHCNDNNIPMVKLSEISDWWSKNLFNRGWENQICNNPHSKHFLY